MSQQRALLTSFSRCSLAASSSSAASSAGPSTSRALHSTAPASAIGADPSPREPREDRRPGGGDRPGGGRRDRGGGRTGGRQPPMPPYEEWIKKAGAGLRIPPPTRGPHWIGSSPFPLNPTFKPPPPLAAHIRAAVWKAHAADPNGQGTPRQLSTRFGIAIERVHAVLRLKALENEWTEQNKPLQTHFEVSMEHLLGSIAPPKTAQSVLDAAAARAAASAPAPAATEATPSADAAQPDAKAKEAEAPPRPAPVERTISAAEAQRRHSEEATPVPSGGSLTGEIRGPHREIFAEDAEDMSSVIAPALAVSLAARRDELRNVATDAPLPSTTPDRLTASPSKPRTRPPLRIVTVGPGSYAGAGVVARNALRAERRSRSRQMAKQHRENNRLELEKKQAKKDARLALTRDWERKQAELKAHGAQETTQEA